MKAIGIIAEFNPLHNGHKYLISEARKYAETVICSLSGNFVQRGDTAIAEKEHRTAAALKAGVDIVLEMPCIYSCSAAPNFALCGVWQLYSAGCEAIIFGSECGDIELLYNAADIILSDKFHKTVSEIMKSGVTFAAARQKAAEELGVQKDLLSSPNNNLGIEYILAAKQLKLSINFLTVKRLGVDHDCATAQNGFCSASFIRECWAKGDEQTAALYTDMKPENISDIKALEKAILCNLRTKTAEDFKNLPDISEGIENRLFEAARKAANLDELYALIKTKRYTLARVRRLIISAFLGFDKRFFMVPAPYARILGIGKRGREHLKSCVSLIPFFSSAKEIAALGEIEKNLFLSECRATDIYALSTENPFECGKEYTRKLIKAEDL